MASSEPWQVQEKGHRRLSPPMTLAGSNYCAFTTDKSKKAFIC